MKTLYKIALTLGTILLYVIATTLLLYIIDIFTSETKNDVFFKLLVGEITVWFICLIIVIKLDYEN